MNFVGELESIYQANLWLRSASRVLVRLGEFSCRDFPDLYRKALRLPWGSFIKPGTSLEIGTSCSKSRLWHGDRIESTVREAIERSMGAVQGDTAAVQKILVRLVDDRCQISVDSSADLLHRRGYRVDVRQAPLRETLAAGILELLGWDGTAGLVDPMCGSGVFVAEAFMIASNLAPGRQRRFAFMQWPGYREGLWTDLCRRADGLQRADELPELSGFDADPEALVAARRNLNRLGGNAKFNSMRIENHSRHEGSGLVLCNPPYGERLGTSGQMAGLYRALGQCYRENFPGWQGAFLCPSPELARVTGLDFKPLARLSNGGIPIALYAGTL